VTTRAAPSSDDAKPEETAMRKTITSMVLGLAMATLSRVACAQMFANPAPLAMQDPAVAAAPPQGFGWLPEVLSLSANEIAWAPGRWDRPPVPSFAPREQFGHVETRVLVAASKATTAGTSP